MTKTYGVQPSIKQENAATLPGHARAIPLAWSWVAAVLTLSQLACAASTGSTEQTTAEPSTTQTDCIQVEVQNTSLAGIVVWIEWENTAPRRMGRVSLNEREVYTLPFRNRQINLRIRSEGSTMQEATNAVLPLPGDRLDLVYRQSGAGALRRSGAAQCS